VKFTILATLQKFMKQIQIFDLINVPLEGVHLIEASAGTGKTYTIANLVVRLIIEKNLLINKILIVTFTEAATGELRERVRSRLQQVLNALTTPATDDIILTNLLKKVAHPRQIELRLKNALRSFDEAAIYTIHSFCSHTLKDHAFESGILFKHELLQDQMPLLLETVQDFWRHYLYPASPLFIRYLREEAKTFKQPNELIDIIGRGRYIGQPATLLHILPESISIPENIALEQIVTNEITQAHQFWQQEGAMLQKLLFTAMEQDVLNRTSYKIGRVKLLCQQMDALGRLQSLSLPKDIELFGIDKLCSKKTAKQDTRLQHPFFKLIQTILNQKNALNECYAQLLLALKRQLFHYVEQQLTRKKQQRNLQSFDDLILNVYQALQKSSKQRLINALRQKYHVALIDEFQDTDPVQYQIFNQVFNHPDGTLFLIGDPKQAIYSFRGADIFAYLQANENIGQTCHHTLDVNYRSEQHLVTAVNTLFQQPAINPFLIDAIQFHPVKPQPSKSTNTLLINGQSQPSLKIWFVSQAMLQTSKIAQKQWESHYIPLGIAHEIAELLNLAKKGQAILEDRKLTAGDIAVLVRTNAQAHFIQNQLTKLAIPSVRYSRESLFITREIVEIERILLAIANPTLASWVKAALATDMLGLSAAALYAMGEHETQWQMWLIRFQRYRFIWQHRGFIQMFRELLVKEQIASRLLHYPDGERRLTNVLHAGELLHQVAIAQKLGINALCYWLAKQRDIARETQDEERMLRLESDEMRVKIVTIHKSKGLEYPIVFCPFLWSGWLAVNSQAQHQKPLLFHDENKRVILDLDPEHRQNHKKFALQEEKSENLRLLYVALTRAKYRCYVTWGQFEKPPEAAKPEKFAKLANSPLSYLLHPTRDFSQPIEDETLLADLHDLVVASKDAVSQQYTIEVATEFTIVFNKYQRFSESATPLQARQFQGSLHHSWKITSFSGLVTAEDTERPDYDETVAQALVTEAVSADILSFPGGVKIGILIHKILELLDFTQTNDEIVQPFLTEQLLKHGVQEIWTATFLQLYHHIINTPLQVTPELNLAQIRRDKRLNELEFFFPLTDIDPLGLQQIFVDHARDNPLLNKMIVPNFAHLQGFMKGFIDMVFEHQGKFYIVDYKSNWLGGQQLAYQQAHLQAAMVREQYLLQYHIYTVALHHYLQLRMPNYQYQQHFGGIFYLFVRGMRPEWGTEYGVYFDRPQPALIADLSNYLRGVGNCPT
jgi:exodeoxyribonuclease V beta subunit